MGQYYKPVEVDENHRPIMWAYSHSFNNGLKLMEHSWVGNNFVSAIERLIFQNPTRIVWAGDYAEPEKDKDGNAIKTLPHEEYGEGTLNLYSLASDTEEYRKLWSPLAHELYPTQAKELEPYKSKSAPKHWRYLVNHETKQYIDKWDIPVSDTWVNPDDPKDTFDYIVHPLPLMTCEGNGQGGGDYHIDPANVTEAEKRIGTWARQLISIETRKPKGYTKLVFDLKE